MKKSNVVVTRSAAGLAKALGLTQADGAEIELRSDLNSKIVEVVGRKGLTHAQVARLAGTSRTRVTAILNRNTPRIFLLTCCCGCFSRWGIPRRSGSGERLRFRQMADQPS